MNHNLLCLKVTDPECPLLGSLKICSHEETEARVGRGHTVCQGAGPWVFSEHLGVRSRVWPCEGAAAMKEMLGKHNRGARGHQAEDTAQLKSKAALPRVAPHMHPFTLPSSPTLHRLTPPVHFLFLPRWEERLGEEADSDVTC